jgi:hypothetical protein
LYLIDKNILYYKSHRKKNDDAWRIIYTVLKYASVRNKNILK